ncbi:HAD-IIIA family hydrolase [Mesorhizobium caraganae]|uniref:HAD-IIIA family hydrolase n=1 Tax=Mesorhizobium caraganae TaxID=483206 RepID=UPI0033361E39
MTNSNLVRQAVVLAGGLGTRLGTLTEITPKPLLPIGGRPFIAYLIDWLARSGAEDIIVSTGYLPEKFAELFRTAAWRDPYGKPVRVTEARETIRAGTAGALALMAERLDERFLLVNGDTFFDCDLPSVIGDADRLQPGAMLMTVRVVEDAGRYGRIEIGDQGGILSFSQKGEQGPGSINAGISILNRSVVDMIEAVPCSLEQDIYPRLAQAGRLIAAERSGYFIDIGLPETYGLAQAELPTRCTKPAAFFDRDGVLNVDHGYTGRVEALEFIEGAIEAVKAARCAGYLTVVVTNQAGVAKGHYDEAAVEAFHREMNGRMREQGAWIDAFYYCPYHPDAVIEAYRGCHPDRKPEPGMINTAIRDLNIDKSRSFLVGDRETDLEAAKQAGIQGYLYTSGRVDAIVGAALAKC